MSSRFMTPVRGSVLLMFALSLVMLIGFAGLVVDAGIGYGVKAKLNSAVDAASIAAARAVATGATDDLRTQAAIKEGTRFYYANFPANYLGATIQPPTVTAEKVGGKWFVTVAGTASTPTYLMRVFGVRQLDVRALGQAVRRDLDMMLVLDTSGSLQSVFPQVKSSAVNFVNKFNNDADRLGLVVFADGATLPVPINKTAARGFNKTTIVSQINAQSSSGWTSTGEAMRLALNDLNAVPAILQSSLRVIVLFSDGAPNTPAAIWPRHNSSGTQTGTVSASFPSTTGSGNPLLCTNSSPCTLYRYNSRSTALSGSYSDINRLPVTAGATFDNKPLSSFNNKRTFSPALAAANSANLCNVNKAARNMLENIANDARGQKVVVFTLGLGAQLNGFESVTSCSYTQAEWGSNILKRVANASGVDTYNADQPTGTYVYAANASDLDTAFNKIASEIIRLSQ
ncbi:MAG: VWA domain-containing protein [bacterium]|nr:VWA domain-containing protein [bacterium]